MAKASPTTSKVIATAFPALLLIGLVFVSALMLADQTETLPLVMLLWLVVPFVALWLFRKLRDRLSGP